MKTRYKEVYFDKWCKSCQYYKFSEEEDPCNECLGQCMNENSHRPINYKKAKNGSYKIPNKK